MSKQIARHLEQVLLGDKGMDRRLYEIRLEELVDDMVVYLAEGNEDFIFALAEDEWDVAMLLIESNGQTSVNERARDRLRELWTDAYERNSQLIRQR